MTATLPTASLSPQQPPAWRVCARWLLAAGLVCCSQSPTLAGPLPSEYLEMNLRELMEIKLTRIADGLERRVLDAPAATTVITAPEIRRMGARDLDEVLASVPGLYVAKNDHYQGIYAIRGMYSFASPETLLLINGVPTSSLFVGGRSYVWGGMPVNQIHRIEVIRGPGSAVHGADAFAGVINVITRGPDEIGQSEVGGRIGAFDTRDGWLLQGGHWSGWDLALTLDYMGRGPGDAIIESDVQSMLDEAQGTHVSHAPGPAQDGARALDLRLEAARDKWRLRLGYQGRRDVGRGLGDAGALDPSGRFRDDRYNLDVTWHDPDFTDHWDLRLQGAYLQSKFDVEEHQRLFPPGSQALCDFYPPGYLEDRGLACDYPDGVIGDPSVSESHSYLNLVGLYSGLPDHTLRLGAGYHLASVDRIAGWVNFGFDPATGELLPPGADLVQIDDTPYAFSREGKRRNLYLFVQDTWNMAPDWELTLGLRHDDYPDFDAVLSPRLSLVWKPDARFTAKLLYGEAFRAPPAFDELYNNTNVEAWAQGNPDLRLEHLSNWELGLGFEISRQLRTELSLFTYQRKDVIGIRDLRFLNLGKIDGEGFEWELNWRPSGSLNLRFWYAWMRGEDVMEGSSLPLVPRHQVFASLDWDLRQDWSLHAQSKWVAGRKRSDWDVRPPFADRLITDLSLHYRPETAPWEWSLSLRNLFDTDARDPVELVSEPVRAPNDLPLQGRNWLVEFRYRF